MAIKRIRLEDKGTCNVPSHPPSPVVFSDVSSKNISKILLRALFFVGQISWLLNSLKNPLDEVKTLLPFSENRKNVSQCWKKCPDSVHYWLKFTLSECSFKKSRKSTLPWEIPGCAPDIYTYIQKVNIRHTNISPLTTSGRICILVFCWSSAQWYLIRFKKLDENRILRKILLCPKNDLLLYFFEKFCL